MDWKQFPGHIIIHYSGKIRKILRKTVDKPYEMSYNRSHKRVAVCRGGFCAGQRVFWEDEK